MKFLVDECVGPAVAKWLKEKGYDAISIYDFEPGIDDQSVLKKAIQENRILITCDKDFGEMVFKSKLTHSGIILLRLFDERPTNKIFILEKLIKSYSNELEHNYVVSTEITVRIIKQPLS